MNKYLPNEKQRAIKVTTYAQKRGASVYKELCCRKYEGNGWWWLRSPGYDQSTAAVVQYDGIINGTIDGFGLDVTNDDIAVRPALFINL